MPPRRVRVRTIAVLAVSVAVSGALWVARERRAEVQRTLLERALRSESLDAPGALVSDPSVAAGDPAAVPPPQGVPSEFWDSYYSDPG